MSRSTQCGRWLDRFASLRLVVAGDGAAHARIVDTHQDQRLDDAAQNQIVRGDIDAPVLAAERRPGSNRFCPSCR